MNHLNEKEMEQLICQVGLSATQDLLSGEAVPQHLLQLVSSPSRFIAWAAVRAAEDLQSVDVFIRDRNLRPLYLQAAQHPDWWVRYTVADRLEFDPPPLRLYCRMLTDPCPAVRNRFLLGLLQIPQAYGILFPAGTFVPDNQDSASALQSPLQRHIPFDIDKLISLQDYIIVDLIEFISNKIESKHLLKYFLDPRFDPVVRIAVVEALQGDETILMQMIKDDHIAVKFAAVRYLQWHINETNWETLGKATLQLTFHPCLLIAQAAVRALRECFEVWTKSEVADPLLVQRLQELLDHEDALMRVNSLYALQHYWYAPKTLHNYLLRKWEQESTPRVKVEYAATLWWWMSPKEWISTFGEWLYRFDGGRYRHLLRYLVSSWQKAEWQEMVSSVCDKSLRRYLHSCLRRAGGRV